MVVSFPTYAKVRSGGRSVNDGDICMALTNNCDIYAAIHDAGINRIVRHVMEQRPSLFNYGSPMVAKNVSSLCCKIHVAPEVTLAQNPIVTPQDPLDVLGTPYHMDYCVQLARGEIDLHPGNIVNLPAELTPPLPPQRLGLHFKVCAGLGCSKRGWDEPPPDKYVVPLSCFSLNLYAIAGCIITGVPGNQVIRPVVDDIEIEELKPEGMAECIECYALHALNRGILPMVGTAASKVAFDMIDLPDSTGHIQVSASTAVPDNPAIEDDQLKLFVDIDHIDLALSFSGLGGGTPGGGGTVVRTVRNRTRTGNFDMTAAVSEKSFQKVFQAVLSGFKVSNSGSTGWGPFTASYDFAAHLEDGSLTLNSDGTIRVKELDVVWDKFMLGVGIDLPTIWIIPGIWSIFDSNIDVGVGLDLSGILTSEISLSVLLKEFYGVGAGVPNRWQTVIVPVLPFDIDLIDISATVGGLFQQALKSAVEKVLGGPNWFSDSILWLLGGVEGIIEDILDIPDDIGEWLLDMISDLGIVQVVLDLLYDYIALVIPPVFEVEDPYPILDADGVLIPVRLPVEYIGIKVDTQELTLNVDMGD